jgi:hypothetical protein
MNTEAKINKMTLKTHIKLGLGYLRTVIQSLLKRIPNLDGLNECLELGQKSIVDSRLDKYPRTSATRLALIPAAG